MPTRTSAGTIPDRTLYQFRGSTGRGPLTIEKWFANDVEAREYAIFNEVQAVHVLTGRQIWPRKPAGPRVRCVASTRDQYIGIYKRHDVNVWRNGAHRPWHFIVTAPDGLRLADGQMKKPGTQREAIIHALTGAMLFP